MNPLFHARNQPHHVRRQIAFVAALGITALVAGVWISERMVTNSFAINTSTFGGEPTGSDASLATPGGSTGLAAVGASGFSGSANTPEIRIVDTGKSSTLNAKNSDPTVIPF